MAFVVPMKSSIIGLFLLLLFGASCLPIIAEARDAQRREAVAKQQESPFLKRSVVVNRAPHRYAIWLPPNYDPAFSWPLIIFLHGAGERGSDGRQQTAEGIGPALVQFPERFPAVVLFPQCPYRSVWSEQFDVVDREVNQTLNEFNIDRRRIYLTGVSLGGFGTWKYASLYPHVFAAIMPISGAGSPEDIRQIVDVPAWVFMNAGDPLVPVELIRWSVLLAKLSNADLRYTEYPLDIHDAWTATYANEKVIDWLFSQSLDNAGSGATIDSWPGSTSSRNDLRVLK
jgi:predicted peptidase